MALVSTYFWCRIDFRPYGGAWNCKETCEVGGQTGASYFRDLSLGVRINARSDVRVRVFDGTDNNSIVSAGFDMSSLRGPTT